MQNFLTIVQVLLSLALIIVILVQAKGTGMGRSTTTSFTRRGLEKLIFRLTFVLAALFLLVSIIQLAV